VRPPGAEAAHRTVRQRKARRTTVLTGAVLVVVAGAAIGVGRSEQLSDSAGPSAKDLARMATQARKVLAHDVRQPVILAGQGPVRANYTRRHAVQAGEFVFDASCIGIPVEYGGSDVTFVINRTPVDARDYNVFLLQVSVPCSPDPSVSGQSFRVRGRTDLIITVKDATAAGKAGFAYRS
jgi:hypothetical protein